MSIREKSRAGEKNSRQVEKSCAKGKKVVLAKRKKEYIIRAIRARVWH